MSWTPISNAYVFTSLITIGHRYNPSDPEKNPTLHSRPDYIQTDMNSYGLLAADNYNHTGLL